MFTIWWYHLLGRKKEKCWETKQKTVVVDSLGDFPIDFLEQWRHFWTTDTFHTDDQIWFVHCRLFLASVAASPKPLSIFRAPFIFPLFFSLAFTAIRVFVFVSSFVGQTAASKVEHDPEPSNVACNTVIRLFCPELCLTGNVGTSISRGSFCQSSFSGSLIHSFILFYFILHFLHNCLMSKLVHADVTDISHLSAALDLLPGLKQIVGVLPGKSESTSIWVWVTLYHTAAQLCQGNLTWKKILRNFWWVWVCYVWTGLQAKPQDGCYSSLLQPCSPKCVIPLNLDAEAESPWDQWPVSLPPSLPPFLVEATWGETAEVQQWRGDVQGTARRRGISVIIKGISLVRIKQVKFEETTKERLNGQVWEKRNREKMGDM